jgi:hypothetical protein
MFVAHYYSSTALLGGSFSGDADKEIFAKAQYVTEIKISHVKQCRK